MQIVGFTFTRISAEKFPRPKGNSFPPNTSLKFLNIEKEKIDLLKDHEGVKFSFRYLLTYALKEEQEKASKKDPAKAEDESIAQDKKLGEVSFEGNIVIAANSDESKEIFKAWKKKEIPPKIKLSLLPILRKCSPKAVQLEDEISLPIHLPFPQISPQQVQQADNK